MADAIRALSDSPDDKDAVAKARAAYDALTDDQKKLVPEDVLSQLTTAEASVKPTPAPTTKPTVAPTATPTAKPTAEPTAVPTAEPTTAPSAAPTAEPTATPTAEPTAAPKVDLSKCKLTVKDQTYTGKALKPAVVVKYGKVKLKQGTDYTVSYVIVGTVRTVIQKVQR